MTVPSRPVLAAGAVVVRGESLLMVERGRPPQVGAWSIPGGRVEEGETLEEAARREVEEETGLEIEIRELLGFVERAGAGYHFLIVDFTADLAEVARTTEPRPGDDAAKAAFVPLGEVRRLRLVPGLADFLAAHDVI